MNVNANGASGAPTTVQKTHGASVRARSTGDDAVDGAGGKSFLSLLHALSAPEPEPALASGLSAKDAAVAGQGADTPADANGVPGGADASVAPALVAANLATEQRLADASAARAQRASSHATRLRPAGFGAGESAVLPDDAEAAQRVAVETTTALDKASSALAGKSAAAAQSVGDTVARQAAAGAQMDPDADLSSALMAAGDVDGERPLPRPFMAALASASASAAPGVSMFEAGLAGLRGATGGRMGERQHARHASAMADGGFVPWTDAMPTGTSHGASPVYAPGATTPVPQAALAQKVHYWVSRGVQSAELQLDAFGGGSVKVHIAVKGDEALVEFRTDQPQARKLLLDAMPQLQALLADEGLNLSGGVVGSSAQQQQQQQSGTGARSGSLPGARQANARVSTVSVTTPAGPTRAVSGAAVDLYV